MAEGLSEEVEIAAGDFTKTRAYELIKLQQQNIDSIGTGFKNLFKRKAVDTETHLLSYGQLLLFYSVLEVPLSQLNWFVRLSRIAGGMNAFVSQIIITLLVQFPLFLLYTTMAYYSKKGYIVFWECIPILQGIGYTTVIVTLLMEIDNISKVGMTILYVFRTFYGIPWKYCNFAGADDRCIPQNANQSDLPSNTCEFASFQYNKYYMRNIFRETTLQWNKLGSIKVDWAITIWICCFIVCISSTIGFKKGSSCLFKLLIVAVFGFAVPIQIVSILHYLVNEEGVYKLYQGYGRFLTPKLWIEGIVFNLPSNSPGVLIYLSSVSPDKMKHPVMTAFRVFSARIVLLTVYLTWYSRSVDQTLHTYNIETSCLDEVGMLQFTVYIEGLSQLALPFVWLNLHYMCSIIVRLATSIITVTATVNSMCQAIPSMNKYRFRICALTCFLIGCACMITTTQGAVAYSRTLKRELSVVFVVLNVIALGGIIFLYGVKIVKHDILFLYKSSFVPIFWYAVTLLPIMLLLLIAKMIAYLTMVEGLDDNMIPITVDGIACLPLLIVPIYQIVRNATGKQPQPLLTPGKGWGVERKLRKARQRFNPEKQVQYNSYKLKCDHYCLVDSTRYKREVFTQTMLYHSLLMQMAENNKQGKSTNDKQS